MKGDAVDVLVAGAGVAGVAAALAAARAGARTLLVEREAQIGGAGYAGLFRQLCGLYLNGENFPAETLNAGFTREVVELLQKAAPQRSVQRVGQLYLLPYDPGDLQRVLRTLCDGERQLRVLCGTSVTAVRTERGRLRGVTVCTPGGAEDFHPAAAVDCSGSGAVAALAGAPCELSGKDERQLAGFTVRVTGLKAADEMLCIRVPYYCARAVRQELLPPSLRFTAFSLGDAGDEGFLKLSLEDEEGPGREERALAQAAALLDYLAQLLPAFGEASIAETSQRVLDREGRRIVGRYTLTGEDVLSGRKFPDGVVKNAWPIELWDRRKGTVYRYLPRGEYYEIPFRCLTVQGVDNLLSAGRCISVTHEALGSTRVLGTCLALGAAAGRAAAWYAQNGSYPEYPKERT